jgi:hypothetical protein
MQLLRIVLVLAAAAAVGGQYLQERYRLTVLEKLPGRQARDRYEAVRRRSERTMTAVAIALGVLGLLALGDLLLGGAGPR